MHFVKDFRPSHAYYNVNSIAKNYGSAVHNSQKTLRGEEFLDTELGETGVQKADFHNLDRRKAKSTLDVVSNVKQIQK